MVLAASKNYAEIIGSLRKEFHVVQKDCCLIDMDDKVVPTDSSFTILTYIQQHKKYVGTTKLYLGINRYVCTFL